MMEIRLKKDFGSFNIDVDFSAPEAGITVLAGASGSGKTTIINMIAGLVKPDSGRVFVRGRTLFDSNKKINCPVNRRRCGYIFQDGRLFPNMNVRKNLLYGNRSESPKLNETAELLGIEHLLNRMPAKLSGGEKQRVSIGRALLMEPDILLMDEPLASLDDARKTELIEYIDRLPEQFNIPIFYVTHSMEEIIRLSDELIRIDNGRITGKHLEDGAYTNLGIQYIDGEYSSVYECTMISYERESALIEAEFACGVFYIPSDKPKSGGFRAAVNASDVIIALEEPIDISANNIFKGTVAQIEEGKEGGIIVSGDLGGAPIVSCITRKSLERLGLKIGMEAFFIVKSAAILR